LNPEYELQKKWATNKIQPIAIKTIYNKVWSNARIIPLDDDFADPLKSILDPAGGDKMIKWSNGGIAFLGQRFRTYKSSLEKGYDDFTLRFKTKYGSITEFQKVTDAFDNEKFIASYYAYGHVNIEETGFDKFRILYFRKFLKLWKEGKIKAKGPIPNEDGSWFVYWPFSKIPSECIMFQTIAKPLDYKQISLSNFMIDK